MICLGNSPLASLEQVSMAICLFDPETSPKLLRAVFLGGHVFLHALHKSSFGMAGGAWRPGVGSKKKRIHHNHGRVSFLLLLLTFG